MQKQKFAFYSNIFNEIVSISNDVQVVSIVNLYGELIYQNNRNSVGIPSEVIEQQYRKLCFSSSMLSFEDIKFILMEINEMQTMIINSDENSILIGINKNSSWKEISKILDYLSVHNLI